MSTAGASAAHPYLLGAPIVIERGGRLIARGTVDAPITFKLEGRTNASAPIKAGGWGGLVLMGDAPMAEADAASGGCWNGTSPPPTYPYGGSAPLDSSGAISHVRVWHAQRGISLLAVGSGTSIEHCEVEGSATDGFTFHGGTVSVRRLSSLNAARAGFRARAGYQGSGQFLFAMLGDAGAFGI
jgi:hypothetical protein